MGRIEERAGLIFSIITSLIFIGAAFGVAQTQINHNKEAIRTYEEDHDRLITIEQDVRWIRQAIKQMEERP
jgi:Pyruvate/2-oxoacid:ferredoxin oxidoreductase gamma subunit